MNSLKSVLIIVPYDNIYPPMNGGMQRCFHVMHQLARHSNLTAIIHQDIESFLKCLEHYPALAKANIYSTKDVKAKDILSIFPSRLAKALRSRWYTRDWKKSADGNLLKYYPILTPLLNQKEYDTIILENLATLNAVKTIRRYDQKVPIVYDAHNVDTNLAKAAFKRNEISSARLQEYYDCESNLYKNVNAIFTCSKDDKAIFAEMNKGKLLIEVIPNGVSIPEKKYNEGVDQEIPEYILFCGSLWSIPNAEGLHWFCLKIWPLIIAQIPSLKLLVVGSGQLPGKFLEIKTVKSIEFTGAVEDVKPYYNKAVLAIVPLLTGSGTRLKVLEAMGLGVPVVSTSIGAEGISCENGKDIVLADTDDKFAENVVHLLRDKQQRHMIGENATRLVKEKYTWDNIGACISNFLSGN